MELRHLFFAGFILLAMPVWASKASFPASHQVESITLEKKGEGVLRYKGLIPVYDAALFLRASDHDRDVLDDIPKRLEVVYRVSTQAERFNEAGRDLLQKNLSSEVWDKIRKDFEQISAWYPDPQKGDRCSITYIPGKGTSLHFNGVEKGTIQGDEFARHYFSIWLGEKPASKSLKKNLLDL